MSHFDLLQQAAESQINTLQYHIEVGSLLSTESRLQTIVDGAKGTFNSFLDSASGFLNGLKLGNYKARQVKLNQSQLAHLRDTGFQDLRTKLIAVPVGFSATYADYLKDVHAVMPAIEGLEKDLKLAIVKIAQILNEPDRLKAQTGIRDLEKNLTLATSDQYDALLANYKNETRVQVPFSDVAGNLAAFTEAYDQVHDLNTRLARVDLVGIQSQIHRLADLVQELRKTVSEDATKDVAGLIAGQLSDLIYRMGVTATVASMVANGVGDLSDTLLTNIAELTKA